MRRKRPVGFRDCLAAARELGADNLRVMDRADAAAAVLALALRQKNVNPEEPGIDWESLIAFVERILPLILTIIDLFS